MYFDRDQWADLATKGILSRRERKAARQELLDHMEDHMEAMLSLGFSSKEAEEQAILAMGDAETTAALLRAAHQPVLTRLLQVCRVAALLLLAAVVLCRVVIGSPPVDDWDMTEYNAQFICYFNSPTWPGVESGDFQGYRLLDRQPADVPLGEYRLTGTKVSVNKTEDFYSLYLMVEVTGSHPFQPAPVFNHRLMINGYSAQGHEVADTRLTGMMRGLSRPNTRQYLALASFRQPPETLVLEYTHPEGGFTHTIDLTGGTVYEKVD